MLPCHGDHIKRKFLPDSSTRRQVKGSPHLLEKDLNTSSFFDMKMLKDTVTQP